MKNSVLISFLFLILVSIIAICFKKSVNDNSSIFGMIEKKINKMFYNENIEHNDNKIIKKEKQKVVIQPPTDAYINLPSKFIKQFSTYDLYILPKISSIPFEGEKLPFEIIKAREFLRKCDDHILLDLYSLGQKENDILVSIVIPVKNVEEMVERLVRSIQNQTFKKLEMIFVDDASTDGTVNFLNILKRFDDRIKIFKNTKNQGILYSRDLGIRNAKGKYILTIDGDDMLASDDAIETMYNLAIHKNVDIVQFNVLKGTLENITRVSPSQSYSDSLLQQPDLGKIKNNFVLRDSVYLNSDEAEIPEVKYDNVNQFVYNKLVKKETFLKVLEKLVPYIKKGPFSYYEDELLSFLLLRIAKSLFFTQRYLYFAYDSPFGIWRYNPPGRLFDEKAVPMFDNCITFINALLDFSASFSLGMEAEAVAYSEFIKCSVDAGELVSGVESDLRDRFYNLELRFLETKFGKVDPEERKKEMRLLAVVKTDI